MSAGSSVEADHVGGGGPLAIDELLRGRAPGLQILTRPDGGYTIRIRGMASTGVGQEPLVLVNGVEVPTGTLHTALAGYTRDDIKQVQVLRDLASTSVYGMRGAGGVILITTTRR
jgi:TonB-dependent SusC/RagA subfamily outer membrane receptor